MGRLRAALLPLVVACAATDPGGPLVVEIDGELFAEYRTTGEPKPILYPLLGPGGVPITRDFPMRADPDESSDHPHHRSLWFAHGDVNGYDFWHGTEAGERIVHTGFDAVRETDGEVTVRSRNEWQVGQGETICTEERTMRFSIDDDGRRIDFGFELSPADGPLVFGDTKEGTMALRLAPTLRLAGEVARGRSLNSAGDQDGECWGKRAAWVAYWGPVEGRTIGVALFDHPQNPRHPTWWHARDYGLFAANPFGAHDFAGEPKGTGDLELLPGQTLELRYRLWIFAGEADAQALEAEFARFSREPGLQ